MSQPKDMTAIDRHAAKLVKDARLAKGLSQKALALRLGVSFQQVQKYEKGTNRMSVGRFVQIADVLGLRLADLF
ncbi:helix-turn-helix domain-containing protein [Lichenihabitans psoromatis]|uniref:helix-turn-helix domain-containing protein n=1 Tax=Lichenihabitans psoromatis TaxID=2528642 RepID=UPI0010384BD1|nr:helix-turn-helix transcriptional regulator [Lichenihabitans psoromatis]